MKRKVLRPVLITVRLTVAEDIEARRLAGLYASSVSDVLRYGIVAMGREHTDAQAAEAEQARDDASALGTDDEPRED